MIIQFSKILFSSMFITLLLLSCGGSSNPPPEPDTSSDQWDQMVWDKDKWGQ